MGSDLDPDFTPFDDMIPADAVPMWGVRVFAYLDPDGNVYDHFHVTGDVTLRDLVGGLDVTAFRLKCQHFGVPHEEEQSGE